MDTRFSLITDISLPLGAVCLDGSFGAAGVWIDFLVAMPRVRVLRYSIRRSTERSGFASALHTGSWVKVAPVVKHRRISFTYTTLYSPWPVGKEFDHARDFCDLFLSRFFQWPAEMYGNRSDIFMSSLVLISEQAETTIASLQGCSCFPRPSPGVSRQSALSDLHRSPGQVSMSPTQEARKAASQKTRIT